MKKFILIFFILINLECIQNRIFIKEVYIKSEPLPEAERKSLVLKKIEKCDKQELLFGAGGDFKAIDNYDKSLKEVLEEAFRISRNNPWHDVKIFKEDKACVILEGYYSEKE